MARPRELLGLRRFHMRAMHHDVPLQTITNKRDMKMDETTKPAMHPATKEMLENFDYDHLPPALQAVSKPFHDLAHDVASKYSGAELTAGLRKLLESKDCVVRAARPKKA